MAIFLCYSVIKELKMLTAGGLKILGHFTEAPDPETIESTKGLTKKCIKYLQGLEIRAEEARGDARWYDEHAAQVLGVTDRTIRNWKKELIRRKLIGIYTQKVINPDGNLRTIQIFRCWRVAVKHRFNIRTKLAWKTDIRPEITNKMVKNVDAKWLVTGPTIMSNQYGTKIYRPAWKDLLDLAQLGLWNLTNLAAKQDFLDAQKDWHPTALKVIGYPLDWKFKMLGWEEEEIKEYNSG